MDWTSAIVGRTVARVDADFDGRHGFTITFDDGSAINVEPEQTDGLAVVEVETRVPPADFDREIAAAHTDLAAASFKTLPDEDWTDGAS